MESYSDMTLICNILSYARDAKILSMIHVSTNYKLSDEEQMMCISGKLSEEFRKEMLLYCDYISYIMEYQRILSQLDKNYDEILWKWSQSKLTKRELIAMFSKDKTRINKEYHKSDKDKQKQVLDRIYLSEKKRIEKGYEICKYNMQMACNLPRIYAICNEY